MNLKKSFACLLSLATFAVGFGQQNYASRSVDIKAGVVILDSSRLGVAPPVSAAPYALYNLTANTSIRPQGWNIYNPRAATVLTDAVKLRWTALDPSVAGIPLGQRLSKRNAAYWEVSLSQLTDAEISDYNFLVVAPRYFLSLNPSEREKLRRFVDRGGILWVELGAMLPNQIDDFNSFPVATFLANAGATVLQQADYGQRVMTSPMSISMKDMGYLNGTLDTVGSPFYGFLRPSIASNFGASGALYPIAGSAGFDFERFQPFMLVNNSLASSSIARLGEGFIVATSRGSAIKLNRVALSGSNYQANTLFTALDPTLESDGIAAAKLAINMLNLAGEYRQQGGGSRKSGGSFIDVQAPMLRKTVMPTATPLTPASASVSPVLYKGMVVTIANDRVALYNADPGGTSSTPGIPTDVGILDFSLGQGQDRIYSSRSFTTPLSSPTCVELPNPGGLPRDVILVVDGDGQVQCLDMRDLTGDLENKAPFVTITPPSTGSVVTTGTTRNAVTVHEGIGYIADSTQGSSRNDGRMWCIDLTTNIPAKVQTAGGNSWSVGGTGTGVQLPDFSSSPTVGYIPIQDNSGGVDKIAYIPYLNNGSPIPGPGNPPGFVSMWLGARGEKPVNTPVVSGSVITVETRVGTRGSGPIYTTNTIDTKNVRLTLLDSSGNPFSATQMAALFSGTVVDGGGGQLRFGLNGGVSAMPATVAGYRVDYNIDLGTANPGSLAFVQRGQVGFPVSNDPSNVSRILGNLALSPQGTVFAVVSGKRGGSLYGVREEGRGAFRVTMRYDAYDRHDIRLNGTTPVAAPAMFDDTDGVQTFLPPIGGTTLASFKYTSGPTVQNGQVYVIGSVQRGFIPLAMVLAFNAEPETPRFRIGTDLPDATVILQSDLAKSTQFATGALAPDVQSVVGFGGFTYERNTGNIRFDNLAGNYTSGNIQNCISLSQPLIIRRPDRPQDFIVEPNTVPGARWTPLRFYMFIHGYTPAGNPLVTGNTLFMAGSSAIVNILTNGPSFPFITTGLIYAINTQVSPSDQFLRTSPSRPWNMQMWQLSLTGIPSDPLRGNPNVLWPQQVGINSFETFVRRLNQTTLQGSTEGYGIAGGEGQLIAWGRQGFYSFVRSDFTICDEGRVAKFDPSGNPFWSASSSSNLGATDTGSVGTVARFVRPTKAYNLPSNELFVVDTDGNRVVKVDAAGIEKRSISGFSLDRNRVPVGFRANETLDLLAPRDVLSFVTYETAASASSALSAAITL